MISLFSLVRPLQTDSAGERTGGANGRITQVECSKEQAMNVWSRHIRGIRTSGVLCGTMVGQVGCVPARPFACQSTLAATARLNRPT